MKKMKFKPRHFGFIVKIRQADAKHPQNPPVRDLVDDADSSVKGMVRTAVLERESKRGKGVGRHSLLLCMS